LQNEEKNNFGIKNWKNAFFPFFHREFGLWRVGKSGQQKKIGRNKIYWHACVLRFGTFRVETSENVTFCIFRFGKCRILGKDWEVGKRKAKQMRPIPLFLQTKTATFFWWPEKKRVVGFMVFLLISYATWQQDSQTGKK